MSPQLLSPRFGRDNCHSVRRQLSDAQRGAVQNFEHRLTTEQYQLTANACPCGGRDDTVVAEIDRYGLPLTTVLCGLCGTLRTNPYLDETSLDDFYRTTYQTLYARASNVEEYFQRQQAYGRRVHRLYHQRLGASPRVLEVGCGAGGGLAAFKDEGCRVAGCELDHGLIEHGQRQGLDDLWHGSIDNIPERLAEERWELIYLHHVFEHVSEPIEQLHALTARLAEGGRVLAIVPDITRIASFPNPNGDALRFLHIAHKFNYTASSLERIGAKAGLVASAVMPPSELQTPWSDMPELWMEFRRPAAYELAMTAPPACGLAVLDYLRETERRYLSGEFSSPVSMPAGADASSASQADEAHRAAPKRFWNWFRQKSHNKAA
jgi:SAM-dependent methyltransferase